jgi:hypothetical protein
MSDKRISEFVAATAAAAVDLFVLVQGGANKKITLANIFANINTPVKINPLLADVDLQVSGDTDANLLFSDASTDRIGVGTATPAQKLDVNGSIGTNGIHVYKSVNTQSAAGAISLTTRTTLLDTTSSFTGTLASGVTGQTKMLMARNTGAVTVTVATAAGFAQIVFNAVGQIASLEWQDGKWFITGVRGATVS